MPLSVMWLDLLLVSLALGPGPWGMTPRPQGVRKSPSCSELKGRAYTQHLPEHAPGLTKI